MSKEIQLRVMSPLFLGTVILDETGQVADDQGSVGTIIFSLVFGFLLLMAIASSSSYLIQLPASGIR